LIFKVEGRELILSSSYRRALFFKSLVLMKCIYVYAIVILSFIGFENNDVFHWYVNITLLGRLRRLFCYVGPKNFYIK